MHTVYKLTNLSTYIKFPTCFSDKLPSSGRH
jgi:hypothetical protein